MQEKIIKVKHLCNKIMESSINIHDNAYRKEDVINFARKYDNTVITINDALDIIRRLDLFQEIKRVLIDKNDGYEYKVMGV